MWRGRPDEVRPNFINPRKTPKTYIPTLFVDPFNNDMPAIHLNSEHHKKILRQWRNSFFYAFPHPKKSYTLSIPNSYILKIKKG